MSHHFPFYKVIVVRQNLRDVPGAGDIHYPDATLEVETEDHPNILTEFGVPESDPYADEITHGPTAPHYWKWHVINHLVGLKISDADYIVFSDSDCRMKDNPLHDSWIDIGIEILEQHSNRALIVGASDGGHLYETTIKVRGHMVRLTQNVSQQMFLCKRDILKAIDFNATWTNGDFSCIHGPFQEYYCLLEGRLWRYMRLHNLYRAILPDRWRYWHDTFHGEWKDGMVDDINW
jgi:hypothetical protein